MLVTLSSYRVNPEYDHSQNNIGSKDSCYQLIKAMTKFKKQNIP